MAMERVAGPAGNPLLDFAQLFGGTKTKTSTSADTSQLQAILAQLQGTDYQAMIEAMFKQAAGQIPGVQSRFGTAIGARTGGTPAQAQLERLLQDTVLRAQEQNAKLQQGNQQIQAQVAGAIANANKTQTQEQGTNLTRAAGVVGGLKAADAIFKSDIFKKGLNKGEELGASLFDSMSNGFNEFVTSLPSPDFAGFGSAVGDSISSGLDGTGELASAAYDWLAESGSGLIDTASDWLGFADGGLVPANVGGGRRSSANMVERLTPQASQANNVQAAPQRQQAPKLDLDMQRGSSTQQPRNDENTPAGFIDAGIGSPVANSLMSSLGRAAVMTLLTGQIPMKPLVQAIGGAANKSIGATDAINKAPDPIGAMLAAATGKQVLTPEVSSSLGSDNLAAAANAVTALSGSDPLDALMQITNGFGTGTAPGGSFGGTSGGSNYMSPNNTSDGFTSDPVSGYSKGGAVEAYFQTNKPHPVRKSDTVPAMLTPGEYVLRAEVVDKIGVDLLEALNNMKIR